jgi:hypothetical protein
MTLNSAEPNSQLEMTVIKTSAATPAAIATTKIRIKPIDKVSTTPINGSNTNMCIHMINRQLSRCLSSITENLKAVHCLINLLQLYVSPCVFSMASAHSS